MMTTYTTTMMSHTVQLRVGYSPCFAHASACADDIVVQHHALSLSRWYLTVRVFCTSPMFSHTSPYRETRLNATVDSASDNYILENIIRFTISEIIISS